MTQHNLFRLFLIVAMLITYLSGRALYYDELDEQDRSQLSSSNEDDDKSDADSRLSQLTDDFSQMETNDRNYDSYEERQFHQRSLVSSSHASRTISPRTRQAIIDILQKAFDQGWRPNLKHYIPATRFGRHRR